MDDSSGANVTSKTNQRVALVTGGSLGIGLAVAARFHVDGFKVYVVGRDAQRLNAAAESIGAEVTPLRGDVSVRSNVKRIMSAVQSASSRLDVLVNNAGLLEIIPTSAPLSQAEEIFDRVVGASLKGSFLCPGGFA
jgi:3-oxoacyl-[acyl-carrier protein] reductase